MTSFTDEMTKTKLQPLTASDKAGFCSMASFSESNTDGSVGKEGSPVIAFHTTAHGVESGSLDQTHKGEQ